MNGTAQLFNGLVSYGIYKIDHPVIAKWKVLFLLTGALTFVYGMVWFFLFPDSSTSAWFLTEDERTQAVNRIKENQTGVENKVFKKAQFYEALTDTKVWLFALMSCINNIPNSLSNQKSTIFTELGFSTLTSTLLNIPSGVVEIVTLASGAYFLSKFPNSRAWISIA
jgi:ACS family allantoate permease-like MFS transporter